MLLIRGALVVGADRVEKADILIKDGCFAKIAPELTRPIDAQIVEAQGWLALPGQKARWPRLV